MQIDASLLRAVIRTLAWLLILAVAIVTLAPINWRPISAAPVNLERFLAFATIGFAFAIAYPRRLLIVIAIVLGAAMILEIAQVLEITRHGRLSDGLFKFAGGVSGILSGSLASRWLSPKAQASQR